MHSLSLHTTNFYVRGIFLLTGLLTFGYFFVANARPLIVDVEAKRCAFSLIDKSDTLVPDELPHLHLANVADMRSYVESTFDVVAHDVLQGQRSLVFKVSRRSTVEHKLEFFAVKIPSDEGRSKYLRNERAVRTRLATATRDKRTLENIRVISYDPQTEALMTRWADQTLSEYLHAEDASAVSNAELLEAWDRFLETISIMHQLGIIHRDIKPENIFVMKKHRQKLALIPGDFDVAALDYRDPLAHYDFAGTPYYMSPSQFLEFPPEPEDDVFALRLTIAESLTHKRIKQSLSPLPIYFSRWQDNDIPRFKTSLEALIDAKVAVALHHPSQSVEELRHLLGLAVYFESRSTEDFLRKYGTTYLQKLARWNPGLAGETIFSSPLLAAHFPAGLGLSSSEAKRIAEITLQRYEGVPLRTDHADFQQPNPWLDMPSLLMGAGRK